MDYGGFGKSQYDDPPHLVEPNTSKEWVRFDGEADNGVKVFSVRSRTRNIRYTVAIFEHEYDELPKGAAICGCPRGMCVHNPQKPTILDDVCWHVKQVLKEARKCLRSMT